MAWSKWRGAVVLVLLGSVGLAWSQSPMFNRPASESTSERTMTVHEDGKALRCRVIQSWRTPAGAQAHQLQVIDTGAVLTIVEDGQPTTVSQGPSRQVRALPMRIFHWGLRDRTPPPGTPMPPQTIQPVAATVPAPIPAPAAPSAVQTTSSKVTTAMPVITSSSCNQCMTGRGPRLAGCTHCKERLISWEEGSKPVTLYPGSTIVQAGQSSGPVIVEAPRTVHTESMPTIIEGSRQQRFPRLFPARSETVVIVPEKSSHSGMVHAATVSRPSTPPSIVKDAAVTQPATKTTTIQSVEIVGDSARPTVREKLQNLFHKPGVAKPAEPKAVEIKKNDISPVQLPAPSANKDDKKPSTLPAGTKTEVKKPAAPIATKNDKKPFSTATAQPTTTPKTTPLAIPSDIEPVKKEAKAPANKAEAKDEVIKAAVPKKDGFDWRKMWGKTAEGKVDQPGQATIDREKVRKELPPASQTEGKRQDILMAPEKFNPENEKVNPRVSAELANLHLPQQPAGKVPTPLGVQSVLSARNGVQGPVQYIPVPVAIVPEPVRPPTPPEPKLPEPPNPAAYLNAFSAPPAPQGQQQPPLTPEQMKVVMQHQALLQQHAYLQQMAMAQRMQHGQTAQLIPVGYGVPMQVRYPANYNGPQAPNPVAQQQPMFPVQQVGYLPPAQLSGNPAMDRRVIPAAAQQPVGADSNTLGQLISVLQQSPYPAQREWAAANLATFDYRVYPHLPHVLLQAARQDAAPTVRAAAVYSLSRMNVQSEPVLGTLQALRGDADPRVRQEVEQAFIRMGLTPQRP